jgi:ABC-type Fe3+-hydroxamate transport system substrate-binding protein
MIYKNESKGIAVILRKDYNSISLKPNEYVNIDEKLVLRFPSSIKKYTPEFWNKINKKEDKKPEVKKTVRQTAKKLNAEEQAEDKKQEVKKTVRQTAKKINAEEQVEDKKETPASKRRTTTKSRKITKKGEENA